MASDRVLIADDDEDIRVWLTQALGVRGWECEAVESGEAARARCEADTFGLIVLDRLMPGSDGAEIALDLRARGCRTPIIVFSARLSEEDRPRLTAAWVFAVSKVDQRSFFYLTEELRGTLWERRVADRRSGDGERRSGRVRLRDRRQHDRRAAA